jgi:hypothetical protein
MRLAQAPHWGQFLAKCPTLPHWKQVLLVLYGWQSLATLAWFPCPWHWNPPCWNRLRCWRHGGALPWLRSIATGVLFIEEGAFDELYAGWLGLLLFC